MDLVQSWQRRTFRLSLDAPNPPIEVDGIALKEVPWIGLHVGTTHTIDVTHIPSGKRIGGFSTLGAALEFGARIAYLLEWCALAPELPAPVVAAIERARYESTITAFAPRSIPK